VKENYQGTQGNEEMALIERPCITSYEWSVVTMSQSWAVSKI